MSFGSAGACFASLLAIITVSSPTCWVRAAFALFAIAVCLLITAGILFEFIVSADIPQQKGKRLALFFAKPGYFIAVAGVCALVGSLCWLLAAAVAILAAVGFFTIRKAL
jgi:hypothetical protein